MSVTSIECAISQEVVVLKVNMLWCPTLNRGAERNCGIDLDEVLAASSEPFGQALCKDLVVHRSIRQSDFVPA